MASEAVRIVKEYFTGLWAGDSTVIDKYLADDYTMLGGDNKPRAQGRGQVIRISEAYMNACSDLEVKIKRPSDQEIEC